MDRAGDVRPRHRDPGAPSSLTKHPREKFIWSAAGSGRTLCQLCPTRQHALHMRLRSVSLLPLAASSAFCATLSAQQPPASPPVQQAPPTGAQAPGAANAAPRRPRPYAQVITDRAHTEKGGVTVHRVDDRWFLEVPDSLLHRDILLVSRVSGVPAGIGGFDFAGSEAARRVVRERRRTCAGRRRAARGGANA